MIKQAWKYVKTLQDSEAIEKFESKNGIQLPSDLKCIIKKFNGGRPPVKYYDTDTETGKEFKTLLSFNQSDIETIYKCFPLPSGDKSLIPFASDPSGDLFVIKDGKIGLWNHEKDTVTLLANTFTEFLLNLHA